MLWSGTTVSESAVSISESPGQKYVNITKFGALFSALEPREFLQTCGIIDDLEVDVCGRLFV